jgi:hypothetical protein
MQTGITGEPTPTAQAGLPAELTYCLHVTDLVAYWVYLCHHARHLLPRAVVIQLRWPAPVVHFVIVAVPAVLLVAVGGPARWAWLPVAAFAILFGGAAATFVADLAFSHRPDRLLRGGRATALYRWLAVRSLHGLAQKQADSGVLNTRVTWRFSMNADGFTLSTGREEVCAGIMTVAGKRIQGPWAALEHVGGTQSHLFLTARDGTAFIVPRGDVPGDAFHDLIVTATRYHRAAVEGGPPATGILLRVEHVQAAPRVSQGVTRAEDRMAR